MKTKVLTIEGKVGEDDIIIVIYKEDGIYTSEVIKTNG